MQVCGIMHNLTEINQLLRFRIQKVKTTCLIFWKVMSNSQHDSWLSQHLIYCHHLHPWTFLAGDHSYKYRTQALMLARPGVTPTHLSQALHYWVSSSVPGKVTAPTL